MIRGEDEKLKELRAKAEGSGESRDLWEYVVALEEKVAMPHSAFLADPGDAEKTTGTAVAHEEAREVLRGQEDLGGNLGFVSGPVQIVSMPEALYVLEIRGQASATAHGYQGFRPARGELLRKIQEAGIPVFLAFKDGGVWETAWLEELPAAKALRLADSREEARFGWYAGEKDGKELFERKSYLSIPLVHEPKVPAQGSLA